MFYFLCQKDIATTILYTLSMWTMKNPLNILTILSGYKTTLRAIHHPLQGKGSRISSLLRMGLDQKKSISRVQKSPPLILSTSQQSEVVASCSEQPKVVPRHGPAFYWLLQMSNLAGCPACHSHYCHRLRRHDQLAFLQVFFSPDIPCQHAV